MAPGEEKHFIFKATGLFSDCIVIGFEDITEKWEDGRAMEQAMLE
jgi:hypothetical protein